MEGPETSSLFVKGPVGRLEAALSVPTQPPTFRAVVAHPHPLHGGSMENPVVGLAAERLVAGGAAVLRFNFRGVGQSGGTHDQGVGEVQDLLASHRYLERDYGHLPCWLVGYSFGAVIVLSAAALEDPPRVDRLLVMAPPINNYDFGFLSELPVPVASICGARDGFTPADELQRQQASWGHLVKGLLVPEAGHDLGTGSGGGKPLQAALDEAIRALASHKL